MSVLRLEEPCHRCTPHKVAFSALEDFEHPSSCVQADLQQQVKDLSAANDRLDNEVDRLETELEDAQAELATSRAAAEQSSASAQASAEASERIASLESQIAELRAAGDAHDLVRLQEKAAEADGLQQQLQAAEERKSALEAEVQVLQHSAGEVRCSQRSLKQQRDLLLWIWGTWSVLTHNSACNACHVPAEQLCTRSHPRL